MKKRIASFVLVLALIFSGAFSCFASAASRSPGQYLFDKYWELIHKAEQEIEDIWNIGRESREDAERDLRQILFDQKETAENPTTVTYDFTMISSEGRSLNFNLSPDHIRSLYPELSDCKIVAYISLAPCDYGIDFAHMSANLIIYAIPSQSVDSVSFIQNGSSFSLTSSSISYYYLEATLDHDNNNNANIRVRIFNHLTGSLSISRSYRESGNYYYNYLLYSEIGSLSLNFSSILDVRDDSDVLNIDLMTNRPINSAIDGSFLVTAGILYDDGSARTYAAGFVKNITISSGEMWGFSFDLDEFADYVYRKRCGLNDYYGFVAVHQDGDCVYAAETPLHLEPGGIFDDVEDPPRWDDYRPEPSPAPDFPDITFDYHPNTNYQTINNYNVDSNSTFNDYFTYFVDASQTINNNVNIISDNVIQFGNAVQEFVENGESACLDYIGELITKFNTDFNDRIDAISEFIGDQFDTLNHNIGVIGDNIVKAIKTQLVPDQEVVFDIMMTKCTFFRQGHDLLNNKEVQQREFKASIPLGYNDLEFDVDFNDLLSAPYYGQLRTFATVVILAATFFAAVNTIFKIFGLGFSSSSGSDE